MNKTYRLLVIVQLFIFSYNMSYSQQTPQSSYFGQNRAFWNPAYTGHNNQMAINTLVKQQWLGVGLNAPRTIFLDYQYPFVDYNMAASAGIVYDQFGPVTKRGLVANYSYTLKEIANSDAQLSLGISASGTQYVYDPTDAVVTNENDPLVAGGNKTSFFPNIGAGIFYISSAEAYRGNTNFYFGASVLQGLQTNVLADDLNQKRISHMVLDIGSKIYSYDYMIEPTISLNYSNPDLINVLAGLQFEMKDVFWAGLGYNTTQELSVQGGYIFDEVGGRDTRLKLGMLGNIGLGEQLTFGPSAELFIRYELDMD